MNSFSHEASTLDHGLPPTAADPGTADAWDCRRGLPSAAEELRRTATALGSGWEMLPADEKSSGLQQRLERLQARLKEDLRRCAAEATPGTASPQLELLESTRMLEAALPKSAEVQQTFAGLPLVRVGAEERLPRVIHLAEMYLAAAKGIWSGESLSVFCRTRPRGVIRCC